MKEEVEKEVIDVNELRFGSYQPKYMYFGDAPVKCVMDGKVVKYNRATYHLEQPIDGAYEATAKALNLKELFANGGFSWKVDALDSKVSSVGWNVNPESIEANTNENASKTTEYRIWQNVSGLEVTGSVIQSKDVVVGEKIYNAQITDVYYARIPASGGTSKLTTEYSGMRYQVWESGKTTNPSSWNGKVTSGYILVNGNKWGTTDSRVTFDQATGEVYAPPQEVGAQPVRALAKVAYVSLSIDGEYMPWYGEVIAYQDENYSVGTETSYSINNSLYGGNGQNIGKEETTLEIRISAKVTIQEEWASGGKSDPVTSDASITLETSSGRLRSGSTSGTRITVSGNTTVYWEIDANTEASAKQPRVYLSNADAGYSESFYVNQAAGEEVEYWTYPILEGSVSVGEIAASGAGAFISANVVQYRKKGDTILQTYYPSIVGIVGSAVSGTGAAFSDGYITASGMGTTPYPSGRKVYTLEKLVVAGGDDNNYDIPLASAVEVRQAVNDRETSYGDYVLSVSASPTSISSVGGIATITASAQIMEIYSWSSGADGGSKLVDSNANLSTSVGTISPSSITGTNQKATLTVDSENVLDASREIVVTLSVGGHSTTCSVWQEAAVYEFTLDTPVQVAYTATQVALRGVSRRNGYENPIGRGNVSIGSYTMANPTIQSVTTDTSGNFAIVVNFGANSANSQKNLYVDVTQPMSGRTGQFEVLQEAAPAAIDYISWEYGSGVWIAGSRYTFKANLIFHNSIAGQKVTVTPMKGGSAIVSGTQFILSGSYYNNESSIMEISLEAMTYTEAGKPFELRAVYGNETEYIELSQGSADPT